MRYRVESGVAPNVRVLIMLLFESVASTFSTYGIGTPWHQTMKSLKKQHLMGILVHPLTSPCRGIWGYKMGSDPTAISLLLATKDALSSPLSSSYWRCSKLGLSSMLSSLAFLSLCPLRDIFGFSQSAFPYLRTKEERCPLLTGEVAGLLRS